MTDPDQIEVVTEYKNGSIDVTGPFEPITGLSVAKARAWAADKVKYPNSVTMDVYIRPVVEGRLTPNQALRDIRTAIELYGPASPNAIDRILTNAGFGKDGDDRL